MDRGTFVIIRFFNLCLIYSDDNDDIPEPCWPGACSARCACCDASMDEGCCLVWWNMRKICYRIVEHEWFETFIILMILLSSAALVSTVIFSRK